MKNEIRQSFVKDTLKLPPGVQKEIASLIGTIETAGQL